MEQRPNAQTAPRSPSDRPGRILAIDQGTTGSTCLVVTTDGEVLGRGAREFPQHFPEPGWVEHEPEEIWDSVVAAAREALATAGVGEAGVDAIGITNQRETTLLWERATGRPVRRAIVWQDRRTQDRCRRLREAGHEAKVRARTGLVLDPYFSGTKIAWMLHEGGLRGRADAGELAFGTVDSFLVHRLSGGERHVTDVTNASRTMLFGLESLAWDDEMLALLEVPRAVLPEVVPSAGAIAAVKGFPGLRDGTPITGIAGDQQAALFGQGCVEKGDVKCTYGTGAFILVNSGGTPLASRFGLLTTVAWQTAAGPRYALEGSAFVAGAIVQWLRDGLGIIRSAKDVEALARSVPDTGGVTLVPALAGLGAPYWDPGARGLLGGLTRGTTAAHVARAALEGVAFEVADLLEAMGQDLGAPLARMRVDGGAAANDLLMQMQADFGALSVERPAELESTARGAAMLAALGAGFFENEHATKRMNRVARTFEPALEAAARGRALARWKDAVGRARSNPAPAGA